MKKITGCTLLIQVALLLSINATAGSAITKHSPAKPSFLDPCRQVLQSIRNYFSPLDPSTPITRNWGKPEIREIKSSGMVLNTHEDIWRAVHAFANRSNKDNSHNIALKDMSKDSGLHSAVLLNTFSSLAGPKNTTHVMERIQDAINGADNLNSDTYFQTRPHFDYDALGTPFFKTSLGIMKFDNQYIVSFSAAYVGDKPSFEVAKAIQAPMAISEVLIKVPVKVVFTVTEGGFVDQYATIDLHQALGKLLPRRKILSLAADATFNTNRYTSTSKQSFTRLNIGGVKVDAQVSLEQDRGPDKSPERLRPKAKGTLLTANAYDDEKELFLEIRILKPGNDYYRGDYRTAEERKEIEHVYNTIIATLDQEP